MDKYTSTSDKPLVVVQCYEDRHQADRQCSVKHPREQSTLGMSNGKRQLNGKPPTPPPMPTCNGDYEHNQQQTYEKYSNFSRESLKNKSSSLVRTPTPDYNNKPKFIEQLKNMKFSEEKAEMESMESHKLISSSHSEPKPPPSYFIDAPNGTNTMKKPERPVSVTIGEYGNGIGSRKQPSKLDFLRGSDTLDGPKTVDDVPISSRLQSELVLTLSRSNLKKKTETTIDPGR